MLRSRYDAAHMRRRFPAAVGLLAVLATVLVPLDEPAGAQSSVDRLRRERRELQQKRAAQAAELNVLQASNEEIGRALDDLEENLRAQEAAVAAARQKAAAELARAEEAKESEARTRQTLEELKQAVRTMAVEEFIRGGAPELDVETDMTAPMETARRRSLLTAAMGRSSDAADRLKQAQEDLARERAAAEQAATDAAAEQQRVEAELTQLQHDAAEQEAKAAQVEERLERALSEADSLASLDSAYAGRIVAEQNAIAARLRTSRPRSGVVTPGGTRSIGSVSVTTVRGIVVATSIADNLAALLNAAEADGITFGGGGYRDSSGQIETRRNNCGSSDYDIYEKPASQCSPPTARPGRSMHEQGLAIDFTQNGSILTRGSSGFGWLKANAGRFGFKNLPTEPWHWSTNGN